MLHVFLFISIDSPHWTTLRVTLGLVHYRAFSVGVDLLIRQFVELKAEGLIVGSLSEYTDL